MFETFAPGACESRGIRIGQTKAEVDRLLGAPPESCWSYSRKPPGRRFRLRLVCFHADKVEMVGRRWIF